MTPAELEAARDRVVPDVVAEGLRVLFCGINPGLMTAATGHHFARPGNRFWPALHASGFTPRRLRPSEQAELVTYGLGITNVVARASARADELSDEEYREAAGSWRRRCSGCGRAGWRWRGSPPTGSRSATRRRRSGRRRGP
ncbi:hypothetical protein Shyhy02_38020 [Streptomyces hygroscopicus subsp. hygroscopicus]|nr:hypothetical protein Shyhy02_38020 [Streptomyces hygroscopicus subsp. hygroscopicus]